MSNVRSVEAPTTTEILENSIENAIAMVDDMSREGLKNTPKRWAKMFIELTSGHQFEFTTFKNEGCNQMVLQTGIQFYSLCEHHLAPFFGEATIAYIPGKRIVGISKLGRTLENFARRLQVQERMTQQVADFLQVNLKPRGVGVLIKARHLCQEMRGVRKPMTETVTSCLKGAFLKEQATRDEFMRMAYGRTS